MRYSAATPNIILDDGVHDQFRAQDIIELNWRSDVMEKGGVMSMVAEM